MPAYNLTTGASYLIIVSTTAIVWSCLVLYIRVFLRRNINGPFGWDDAACTVATITGAAESIITLVAVHYGLGFHVYDVTAGGLQRVIILLWLVQMLYILTVGFSMLSIACLISRITKFRTHLILARVTIVLIGMWTLVSTLVLAFQCAMPDPWTFNPPSRCVNRWYLWLCITSFQACLECCNLKTAFILVWQVQMPLKAKAKVFVAFALRLLSAPLSTIRIHHVDVPASILPPTFVRLMLLKNALPSDDPTHDRVEVNLMNQIVMHIGILLATIPCAKPFFVVFERGVFKSPFDPGYSATRSYDLSGDNHTLTRASTNIHSAPISWNYRSTFAKGGSIKPPATVKQKRRVMFAPWTWNNRGTSASPSPTDTILATRKSKSSNSSSNSDSRRSRPTYSSHHSSHLKVPEGGNTTREGHGPCYGKTRDSSRSSSRLRRQSELEWSGTLRPDVSTTISMIGHDPVVAAEWHDLRSDETVSERDVRIAAIETTQTFEVTYSLRDQGPASRD